VRYGKKRGWEIGEEETTPEGVFVNRRRLVKALAASPLLVASPLLAGNRSARALAADSPPLVADPSAGLYPLSRNTRYTVSRPLTEERLATSYTNFIEFGFTKDVREAARALPVRPWTVVFDGLVEKPRRVAIDDLLKAMPLEERVYRHRCVEAWSMVVPWSGFPMQKLVEYARPLGSAKYLEMQTFLEPEVAPRQGGFWSWLPWPFVEGLAIEEATNELAFVATGIYGKPLPPQNGSPLRLVVPWKYGFKSIKSIVRFTFTDTRPVAFWEKMTFRAYDYWENIDPEAPYPSLWEQKMETPLGTDEKVPTRPFNGYGEFVASLYRGKRNGRL
jgi:sulfoxide reductase catalytic subunit YedY